MCFHRSYAVICCEYLSLACTLLDLSILAAPSFALCAVRASKPLNFYCHCCRCFFQAMAMRGGPLSLLPLLRHWDALVTLAKQVS